ncbi:response regulator transcription factor [Alteromonas sp. C1M14]|uniref:response regulator transcription factor n=1 Tax=Alteromonas sp. C1M14 TaxID=2841567 RepID=UPI001C0A046C|nr:response regulator transcription factor [Alteromonas sp. C1M14]MBU2977206.1 response regulator transcription factor [Alteromonas sp. C1M14]
MEHKLIANQALDHCSLLAMGAHVYHDMDESTDSHDDVFYWVHTSSNHWLEQVNRCVATGKVVILMTANLTLEELQLAMQAGARGYCADNIPLNEIIDLISAVEQGGIWIPGGMLGSLIALLSQHPAYSRVEEHMLPLSDREKQVVNEVLTGASNLTIANNLSITVRTVKDHMASIFKKLAVKDRVQLLLKLGQFR